MAQYKKITNYWHNNTEYWDSVFKGIDFSKILEDENKISWKDLQYIGGFDLPFFVKLEYINPESVFNRLVYFLSNSNIIAASELIKMGAFDIFSLIDKFTTSKQTTNTDNARFYGFNTDTGFITDKFTDNDADTFNDNDLFIYKNLKILSIHLRSTGPNTSSGPDGYNKTSHNKTYLTIEQFIEYEFSDKQIKKNVNVICGDTNITESKSRYKEPNITRDTLGKQIASALNKYFSEPNKEWLVLMSSHKIIKNRHGFILRNQQLLKSIPISKADTVGEADGTILAIKIYTSKKTKIINFWKEHFTSVNVANEYVIYCHANAEPITPPTATRTPPTITTPPTAPTAAPTAPPTAPTPRAAPTTPPTAPSTAPTAPPTAPTAQPSKALPTPDEYIKIHTAFNFQSSPETSIDDNNTPIEKIFLDHSVLYSSLSFLLNVVDKDIDPGDQIDIKGEKLIVLNLNSMINTKKGWNLKVKNYINKIKILDRLLHDIMKPYIFTKKDDIYIKYNEDYSSFDATNLYYKILNEAEYTALNAKLRQELDYSLMEATKYLKKGYYEKYIKYKTKYLNLKNT